MIKTKTTSQVKFWKNTLRLRVGDSVLHNGNTYTNFSGRNSEPPNDEDWELVVGDAGGGSSVEVVDNLTTDDATKALSARQGKVISDRGLVYREENFFSFGDNTLDTQNFFVVKDNVVGNNIILNKNGNIFKYGNTSVYKIVNFEEDSLFSYVEFKNWANVEEGTGTKFLTGTNLKRINIQPNEEITFVIKKVTEDSIKLDILYSKTHYCKFTVDKDTGAILSNEGRGFAELLILTDTNRLYAFTINKSRKIKNVTVSNHSRKYELEIRETNNTDADMDIRFNSQPLTNFTVYCEFE